MKSPIKASLRSFDDKGDELAKPVTLHCHFAHNEPIQTFEVILDEVDGVGHTSVYIDYKTLMKEVERYERSK